MKFLIFSLALFEVILFINGEEDIFLKSLKIQFENVPKDIKLFDFLQSENNLKGLIGLHNDMCQQLNHYNQLKSNHRARRDAETTSEAATSTDTATSLFSDAAAVTNLVSDIVKSVNSSDSADPNATGASSTVNVDVTDSTPTPSSSQKRRRRDATDASAVSTNATIASNQTNDKDEQQNLNDQEPPSDDQGNPQAPAGGEQQEAEMQAAGLAYFKNIILTVLRYILNCLMTYINIFY